MNWITRWKKIGIKVKQILKKQPEGTRSYGLEKLPSMQKNIIQARLI